MATVGWVQDKCSHMHIQIMSHILDCFEPITSSCTSTGNISNHTESKSWSSQITPSDLVSAPPDWTIAVIAILLVLLLIETITCVALWVMCLKWPGLYNKVRKAQTLTRHTSGESGIYIHKHGKLWEIQHSQHYNNTNSPGSKTS